MQINPIDLRRPLTLGSADERKNKSDLSHRSQALAHRSKQPSTINTVTYYREENTQLNTSFFSVKEGIEVSTNKHKQLSPTSWKTVSLDMIYFLFFQKNANNYVAYKFTVQ